MYIDRWMAQVQLTGKNHSIIHYGFYQQSYSLSQGYPHKLLDSLVLNLHYETTYSEINDVLYVIGNKTGNPYVIIHKHTLL